MSEYTRNVEMLRNEGIRVIKNRIPREVRKELNEGVKKGHIKHLKRDRLKPEIYCHPDQFEAAQQKQIDEENEINNCVRKIVVNS